MHILTLLFILTGIAGQIFFLQFLVTSLKEKKSRAALISLMFAASIALVWCTVYLVPDNKIMYQSVSVTAVIIFAFLFFTPVSPGSRIRIQDTDEKVDERDTMFARSDYAHDSEKWKKYYAMRPENLDMDNRIKSHPELLAPGGKFYDPVRSEYVVSLFQHEESHVRSVDGPVSANKKNISPEDASVLLKEFAHHLGAKESGITELDQRYIYSHVGRGPEQWGSEIVNNHTFALVFTVEMDFFKVENAPDIDITEESANQYLNAQKISIPLAQLIRNMGYSARAHLSGSNYQIMLPPVAWQAGLGELGRHGYLISRKYGSRVRLGAVTTDLPLVPDKPIEFGVQEFCEICKKCADNCPSGSIPKEEKTFIRGVEKWMLDDAKCFRYWRIIGTDCGLCMKVCPFSHPYTAVHNILRYGIANSSFARKVSLYGDDLFYGKKCDFPKYKYAD